MLLSCTSQQYLQTLVSRGFLIAFDYYVSPLISVRIIAEKVAPVKQELFIICLRWEQSRGTSSEDVGEL